MESPSTQPPINPHAAEWLAISGDALVATRLVSVHTSLPALASALP